MQRKATLFGALAGLGFGLLYWFAWGCRSCARNADPYLLIALFVVFGAVVARRWSRGHEPPPFDVA